MFEVIAYYSFTALVFLLRLLPRPLRRLFFKALATLLYPFSSRANRIIDQNLQLIYQGSLSQAERTEIKKFNSFNLTLWVLALIENSQLPDSTIQSEIDCENMDYLINLHKENKPVILISPHFGNIMMLSHYINTFVCPVAQVMRRSNLRLFDRFILREIHSSGSTLVYKKGAMPHLRQTLQNNGVISVLIDQHVSPTHGSEVDLLGVKVLQTTSTAMLSREFNATIVPIAIFNQDDYRYKIKLYEPILPLQTGNEEQDLQTMTQQQADVLTTIINEDKKQWFWMHRRFKSHHEEIYKD